MTPAPRPPLGGAPRVLALLAVLCAALPASPLTAPQDFRREEATLEAAETARTMRQLRHGGDPQAALDLLPGKDNRVQRDQRVVGEAVQALIELGDLDQARQRLNVLNLGRGGAVAAPLAVAVARVLLATGDAAAARANVDLLAGSLRKNADLRLVEAQVLLAEGDLAGVASRLDDLRGAVAEGVLLELELDLVRDRAAAMMASEDLLERAVPLLRDGLERGPHRADLAGLLVRALARFQRFDEGQEVGAEALERAADDKQRAEVLYALGFLYRTSQQDEQAVEHFEQVLELFPNHAKAQVGLARCQRRSGNDEEALALLEKVLARRPDSIDALLALAEVHGEQGDVDQARAALETILEGKPKHLKALWMLSRLEARGGNMEAVDALMERYEARKAELEAQG